MFPARLCADRLGVGRTALAQQVQGLAVDGVDLAAVSLRRAEGIRPPLRSPLQLVGEAAGLDGLGMAGVAQHPQLAAGTVGRGRWAATVDTPQTFGASLRAALQSRSEPLEPDWKLVPATLAQLEPYGPLVRGTNGRATSVPLRAGMARARRHWPDKCTAPDVHFRPAGVILCRQIRAWNCLLSSGSQVRVLPGAPTLTVVEPFRCRMGSIPSGLSIECGTRRGRGRPRRRGRRAGRLGPARRPRVDRPTPSPGCGPRSPSLPSWCLWEHRCPATASPTPTGQSPPA